MKQKLTTTDGMTWKEVFHYYFPNMGDSEIDMLLWEMTCFPFDVEQTLEQIYQIYLKNGSEI